MWEKPTHVVTRRVRSEVLCLRVKETGETLGRNGLFPGQEEGDCFFLFRNEIVLFSAICHTTIKYKMKGGNLVSRLSWKIP